MPSLPERGLPGFLTDEQTRDYPDSRYERDLQLAIEHGDQPALDRLLARRSTGEMIQMAAILIGASFGVMLTIRVLAALRVF
jgi:hypothetical protein